MPNLRIQSPLQFPGYTQTLTSGIDGQVLTYNNSQATWQDVPGITPNQLPCAFNYFISGFEIPVPATLFTVDGKIPASQRRRMNDGTTPLISGPITLVDGTLPCRDYDSSTDTYTDNNITLRF